MVLEPAEFFKPLTAVTTMCLAIPAKIIHCLPEQQALVDIGGVQKQISLSLLPCSVTEGDYVIVHVGFALNKLDQAAAEHTLQDFTQMLEQKP